MTDTITLRGLPTAHDGLQVTLLWDEDSNEVSIGVIDDQRLSFWLPVAPARARRLQSPLRLRAGMDRAGLRPVPRRACRYSEIAAEMPKNRLSAVQEVRRIP
jgi:hypothetical protein